MGYGDERTPHIHTRVFLQTGLTTDRVGLTILDSLCHPISNRVGILGNNNLSASRAIFTANKLTKYINKKITQWSLIQNRFYFEFYKIFALSFYRGQPHLLGGPASFSTASS